MILNILSGTFLYLSLCLFVSPAIACLGAIWFWAFQPDFFYTYNHAGGITALMAIVYCLFLYIQTLKLDFH
jgi:hypothetical protein